MRTLQAILYLYKIQRFPNSGQISGVLCPPCVEPYRIIAAGTTRLFTMAPEFENHSQFENLTFFVTVNLPGRIKSGHMKNATFETWRFSFGYYALFSSGMYSIKSPG